MEDPVKNMIAYFCNPECSRDLLVPYIGKEIELEGNIKRYDQYKSETNLLAEGCGFYDEISQVSIEIGHMLWQSGLNLKEYDNLVGYRVRARGKIEPYIHRREDVTSCKESISFKNFVIEQVCDDLA